jgi:IS4 transposase
VRRAAELIYLITSILDPSDATATELATAYHERWESETGFREKKTYAGPDAC